MGEKKEVRDLDRDKGRRDQGVVRVRRRRLENESIERDGR